MRSRLALVAVFFVLSLVKVSRHEIWADEAEFWDAARNSHSLGELYDNTLYIGQPLTTFLPFYAASRLTRDPFAMQVVNVVEMTGVVAVVAFAAPWPLACSALFAVGYFPFFEYGTISRHYALPFLCGAAFCAFYRRAGRLDARAAIAAGLLALASFHGTILVLGLLLAFATTWLLARRAPRRSEVLGVAFVVVCIGLSIRTAVPPPDSSFLKPWRQAFRPDDALASVASLWTGYAPLPPLGAPWWNHNLLDPWPAARLVLGLLLLGLALWSVRRSALATSWLVFATLGLLAFGYLQWGGYVRHAGLLFMVFVFAAWLAGSATRVVLLMFALQVPGGLVLSYKDLLEPFCPSVQTADYMRRNGLEHFPLVGHKEFIVSSVFVLLDRRFYSTDSRRWVTRPEFSSRMRRATLGEVRQTARRLARQKRSDVILVVNHSLDTGPGLRRLACFHEQFVGQDFCVYRLLWTPPAQARSKTSSSAGATPSNAS